MAFDPSKFANQTYSGGMSTAYPVPKEGDYPMQIGDFDEKTWFRAQTFTNDDGTKREAVAFEIPMEILDDSERSRLGVSRVLTRYRGFIDLDGNGGMDMSEGKNVKIGRLRDVFDQNSPTTAWSWPMLANKGPFMGHVRITSDKKDPEVKYSEVSRVSKMGA